MSERMREWFFWIAATILVAAGVHYLSLFAIPRVVMHRVLDRMGAANTMHFGRRPDANARAVVRPSPDILYATCPYDLSAGPLRVKASVPHGDYWSVSAFDAATDNFYVKNDRQVTGDTLEITLVKRGQKLPPLDAATESDILFSPSSKGVILFRAVIASDSDVPKLAAILRRSSCATVASRPGLR